MQHTQYLIFEITPDCNYAARHAEKCPTSSPERWKRVDTTERLTDDEIMEMVGTAYDKLGFQGYVGWHYYNEPMLEWARLQPLMRRIVEAVPQAKFVLWTNGSLMPRDLNELAVFAQVRVSNYDKRNWEDLWGIVPDTHVSEVDLDGRLDSGRTERPDPCLRMFGEIIIDAYGNGHICCIDWRGECLLGNVHSDGFEKIVERFLVVREQVKNDPMSDDAPKVCRTCDFRVSYLPHLVPSVREKTCVS